MSEMPDIGELFQLYGTQIEGGLLHALASFCETHHQDCCCFVVPSVAQPHWILISKSLKNLYGRQHCGSRSCFKELTFGVH